MKFQLCYVFGVALALLGVVMAAGCDSATKTQASPTTKKAAANLAIRLPQLAVNEWQTAAARDIARWDAAVVDEPQLGPLVDDYRAKSAAVMVKLASLQQRVEPLEEALQAGDYHLAAERFSADLISDAEEALAAAEEAGLANAALGMRTDHGGGSSETADGTQTEEKTFWDHVVSVLKFLLDVLLIIFKIIALLGGGDGGGGGSGPTDAGTGGGVPNDGDVMTADGGMQQALFIGGNGNHDQYLVNRDHSGAETTIVLAKNGDFSDPQNVCRLPVNLDGHVAEAFRHNQAVIESVLKHDASGVELRVLANGEQVDLRWDADFAQAEVINGRG